MQVYQQLCKTENFHEVRFCEIASILALNVAKCNSIQHGL